MKMKNNALIYCRVSTEEQAQEGFSLDAQERFCREYATNNDLRVIGVFRDEGKSGTNLERPALKNLLDQCQKDSSINAVIIQETDRLARNTKDHLTVKALLQKSQIKLISVAQPMLDDSPEGNMIDTIIASVNQFQSDQNSRKTRKGLKEKFDDGWWPGWAPLGYKNVPVGGTQSGRKARKVVRNDPDAWELVKSGFKLYLAGDRNVDEIINILHRKGLRSKTGKKIPHSVMAKLLQNPFYAGIMRWNGQEKRGNHKPMITLKEHQQILKIMQSRTNNGCRQRKHRFLLGGLVYCTICGRKYTADKHPIKNKQYYHCSAPTSIHSNRGQNVATADLENQVEESFKQVEFSQEFIDGVVSRINTIYHQYRDKVSQQKQRLLNKKQAIENKRDKAEEKLLSGVISDCDYVRIRGKYKKELELLQDRIDELEEQRELDIDIIEQVLKLARNAYRAYKDAPVELKRRYLALFWEKFLVKDREIVEAVPTSLIRNLLRDKKVLISSNWLPSPSLFRTLEDLEKEGYFASLRAKYESLIKLKASLSKAA